MVSRYGNSQSAGDYRFLGRGGGQSQLFLPPDATDHDVAHDGTGLVDVRMGQPVVDLAPVAPLLDDARLDQLIHVFRQVCLGGAQPGQQPGGRDLVSAHQVDDLEAQRVAHGLADLALEFEYALQRLPALELLHLRLPANGF